MCYMNQYYLQVYLKSKSTWEATLERSKSDLNQQSISINSTCFIIIISPKVKLLPVFYYILLKGTKYSDDAGQVGIKSAV